jgi:hypothetical protein
MRLCRRTHEGYGCGISQACDFLARAVDRDDVPAMSRFDDRPSANFNESRSFRNYGFGTIDHRITRVLTHSKPGTHSKFGRYPKAQVGKVGLPPLPDRRQACTWPKAGASPPSLPVLWVSSRQQACLNLANGGCIPSMCAVSRCASHLSWSGSQLPKGRHPMDGGLLTSRSCIRFTLAFASAVGHASVP